jgi:hypothetical protein
MVPGFSVVLWFLAIATSSASRDVRVKRNIGIFNVVRFQNVVCEGSNNQQGTCYTTEECENNKGEASGSCADGYGVCCTFSVNCGGRSSQNNTVFMSNNPDAGECAATICPIDDTISQIRLDFTTFVIGDPSDSAVAAIPTIRGVNDPVNAAAIGHSTAGQCLQDTFIVTSPGSPGSDTLCGTNSGEHLYIDASQSCNTLMFILGAEPAMEPMWSITVRQYAEDFTNLAPKGCDQYHFDSDDNAALNLEGEVSSFNYNNGNGRHLASQHQTICIRREAGMTRVCFSQAGDTEINDFRISSGVAGDATLMSSGLIGIFSMAGAGGATMAACGNYGTDGLGVDYDFVHIPKAQAKIGDVFAKVPGNHNFCGAALVGAAGPALTTMFAKQVGPAALTTTGAGTAVLAMSGQATICTNSQPFRIRFVSDSVEVAAKETLQTGFFLGYVQWP